MPPALSDEESSDTGLPVTTLRSSRSSPSLADDAPSMGSEDEQGHVAANGGSDINEEDEEADDLEEDVFIVEAIKSHMIDEDGSLRFQVKWEGYESKKDLTWEPEENLEDSAQEILDAYFRKFGGRENIFNQTEKAARGKKRGRGASNAAATATTTAKRSRKNGTHPANSTPPASAKAWQPPAGSWEDEIEKIDACGDGGGGKLVVYLIWKNGQKTKHDTTVIYKKCPQKMLQFYEQHVKIIRDDEKAREEDG